MIQTSVAFSKRLVTRTNRVSAITYMILGTGKLLIIFLFGGLCWLLVKWQIALLSFFFQAWTRQTAWLKFWKYSYTEAKVSSLYQTDLLLSNSSAWHWGKYRGSKMSFSFSSLNENTTKLMYTVKCIGPKYFSLQWLKDERTKSSSPFSQNNIPQNYNFSCTLIVRGPDYSFSPAFDTHLCISHLKFDYCTTFFGFYM